MNRKIIVIGLAIVLASLTAWFLYNKYRVVIPPVDVARSEIGWSAKSVSDTHFGKINLSKAELQFQNNVLLGGSFEADMNSITVADINDAQSNRDFINHIGNEDFFEVNLYPTATFRTTAVRRLEGNQYKVDGIMTIKNQEQPVSFTAEVLQDADGKRVVATLPIDRTRYGIAYGSQGKPGSHKDWFIHDEFLLNINVVIQ